MFFWLYITTICLFGKPIKINISINVQNKRYILFNFLSLYTQLLGDTNYPQMDYLKKRVMAISL